MARPNSIVASSISSRTGANWANSIAAVPRASQRKNAKRFRIAEAADVTVRITISRITLSAPQDRRGHDRQGQASRIGLAAEGRCSLHDRCSGAARSGTELEEAEHLGEIPFVANGDQHHRF